MNPSKNKWRRRNMRIGTVFGLPMPGSRFGTVRDEYGNNRTTWAKEMEEDADVEDDFAYRTDFFKGGGVTLRAYEHPEEDD
jgi:hypothetical protein